MESTVKVLDNGDREEAKRCYYMVESYKFYLIEHSEGTEVTASYQCGARVVSHKTGLYLNGVVGLDGWANFAIAIKAYADSKPMTCLEKPVSDYVYLMLMGYALENLAKGIIAHKAYTPAINDVTPFEQEFKKFTFKRRDGKVCYLGIHDLDDLYMAEDIGFEVSDNEIAHLKVLTIYIEWKGRYPIPQKVGKIMSSSEPGFEELSATSRRIYDKATEEIERLRSLIS
jgi:hypothetical protein